MYIKGLKHSYIRHIITSQFRRGTNSSHGGYFSF